MAEFSIVGVYRIIPTLKSILEAVHYHRCDWLLNPGREYIDPIHWNNFNNLVLIEVEIKGEFSSSELSTISQNDQAPYMEFYMDSTGIKYIPEDEAIRFGNRRVCFFLHDLDIIKPLQVGSAILPLPEISELPDRLKPFAHYLPVD